jgi:hypothetical protein
MAKPKIKQTLQREELKRHLTLHKIWLELGTHLCHVSSWESYSITHSAFRNAQLISDYYLQLLLAQVFLILNFFFLTWQVWINTLETAFNG